ncbi:MAG TPA: PorP/SprF family type IX secretion system membrane protein [Puia sp.]|jgi:type IX secretion system PorP/SprF family membrane protein|nr:PorP/SprF family type IX secretion system membrane protein [Puia sp.]
MAVKKFLLLSFLTGTLLLVNDLARAQDIHFSQFYESPLLRNPALAGVFTGDYRISTLFRDQWNSFNNAYRTGSLSGEYKWNIGKANDYLTTGLEILYDKAGTAALTTTEVMPALNYHKSLSNQKPMYLALGFMGGVVEKTLDMSKVTTNSQYNGTAYDPALPNGETITTPTIRYIDGALGISFNTAFGADYKNTLYFGVGYFHLNRPKNSFYQNPTIELDPKVVVSAGVHAIINDYLGFTIQADHSQQGSFQESIGGVMVSYKLDEEPGTSGYTFNFGSYIRWGDAIIPVIKLESNAFTIGLSYDVNISSLQTVSEGRGGFELSLSYIGFLEHENPRYLCPKF